ncbi:MAG: hypothetical protein BWK73_20240 [Thiothrix lacustris]|uniref:Uncharacterized protein n=1 Tax=Thiothrix lacustris TaxID=525917 RepID=A0A1Y1QP76_9GAMM|nr:MAG: hypothetical protein BWK73_20240 [Thiothrix lacustris]
MSRALVNRTIVSFEPIPFLRVLEMHPPERIARVLKLPMSILESWGYSIPPVWSQYIRESEDFTREVIRRHMRYETACAVLRIKRRSQDDLLLPHRYEHPFLPEHESLRLEYTYRGFVACEPIGSQQDTHVIMPGLDAMLGVGYQCRSHLLPQKPSDRNVRGILSAWREKHAAC